MGRPIGSGEYCPKPGELFRAFEGQREALYQPTSCTKVDAASVHGVDGAGNGREFRRIVWTFKPL